MNNLAHQPSSTSTTPLPESWIERLFDKMLMDYGRKFTDQWAGADPDKLVAHWSRELAGYTGAELKRGYDGLADRDWPPTLPEFKRMCRPPVDNTIAYYQAINGIAARDKGEMGEWPHPAIFWAAMSMEFDLRGQTYSTVKNRWEAALQREMERDSWPEIPAPLAALPSPGQAQLTREEADKRVKELKLEAGGKQEKTDHLLWMKRILAREKKGDKTLTALQKREAKEAARNVGYRP